MTNIRSRKVLDSARGQPCSARFPGICNGNPETTVWAHLNGAAFGKGMAQKAHDVLGFHSCSSCHSYYDVGHGTRPILTTDQLLECILGAVCETWVRLIRMKLLTVVGDAELQPRREPKPTVRKPRGERRAVPKGPPLKSANNLPKKGEMKFNRRLSK
jgi:hypothetical protein